ncbi:MAG: glycosyltransferase family 2 protein [Pseudomonadota bacterium]
MTPDISIIIVTYQAAIYIDACLESLNRQTAGGYSVVIVDNGSTDGTVGRVRRHMADRREIHLIENRENLGFARANNIGIRYALHRLGTKAVFLLNQDTVCADDLLEKLHYWAQREPGAVLGPKILIKTTGRIWWIGTHVFTLKDLFQTPRLALGCQIDKEAPDHFFHDAPAAVAAIVGCALMIPRTVLDDVGPLDERFFMYGEDLDFSLRLQKKGLRMLAVPDAVVYHDVQRETEALGPRNRMRAIRRYVRYFLGSLRVLQKHYSIGFAAVWIARMPVAAAYEIVRRVLGRLSAGAAGRFTRPTGCSSADRATPRIPTGPI